MPKKVVSVSGDKFVTAADLKELQGRVAQLEAENRRLKTANQELAIATARYSVDRKITNYGAGEALRAFRLCARAVRIFEPHYKHFDSAWLRICFLVDHMTGLGPSAAMQEAAKQARTFSMKNIEMRWHHAGYTKEDGEFFYEGHRMFDEKELKLLAAYARIRAEENWK